MPIIAEGWVDAALQQNNEAKNDNDNDNEDEIIKPPTEFQINFMKGLLEMKDKLKPSSTEIKSGIKHDCEDSDDTPPALPPVPFHKSTPPPPTEKSHQHLEPDYGWSEAHGFRGNENWELPLRVKHCEEEARPGYATRLAHEYNDAPEVLQEKVTLLAQLLRQSEHCLLYTGAGISTASGIGDYATRTGSSSSGSSDSGSTGFVRPKIRSPYEAQPTFAHRSFVALHHAKFIDYWVQQNHDGLPQKVLFKN